MNLMGKRPTTWAMVIGSVLLIGCSIGEQFKAMQEDSAKAKAAIESEFGGEVQIGWNVMNGKVAGVRVAFSKPPARQSDLTQFKHRIAELVNRSFRRPIERVEVLI